MNNDVVLSLCIPTYNRAEYLDKTLGSIVEQIGNNPEVEVLISDNVSDDNTKEICLAYAEKYSNVSYHRNETNIGGDRNFIQVLQLANGSFLKLLNDYVEFKDGSILKMVELVKSCSKNKEILFFTNGGTGLQGEYYYTKSLDEFINVASFWTTWISAFGIWKEYLPKVLDTIKFKTTNYRHTEILFACFDLNPQGVTYTKGIYKSNEVEGKKAAYNFFGYFIDHYLNTLIKGLRDEKKISNKTYRKEKNRLLSNFVFYWYKRIKIKKDPTIDFNTEGMEEIIFRTYKYSPVFYRYLLYMPFYMIGFYFKKISRSLKVNNPLKVQV